MFNVKSSVRKSSNMPAQLMVQRVAKIQGTTASTRVPLSVTVMISNADFPLVLPV